MVDVVRFSHKERIRSIFFSIQSRVPSNIHPFLLVECAHLSTQNLELQRGALLQVGCEKLFRR